MTSPNHELFVKVLAQIEKHPETHDQGDWINECGTAMCFAGHAAITVSGLGLNDLHLQQVVTHDGRELHVSDAASELLGIPFLPPWDGIASDGWRLFDAANTLRDLYRISAEILGLDETVLRDKVAAEVSA